MRTGNRVSSRTVRKLVSNAFGAVLLALSAPAYVHHSGAMFDREKETTITGVVTQFNWTNPHASFRVGCRQRGWQDRELGHRDEQPEQPRSRGLEAHDDQAR
jgi:hypothetical protein